MSVVIPPGFASVAAILRNTGDPEPWYVTWAVDVSEAGGDWDAVGDVCGLAFETNILGSLNAATTLEGIQLRVGQDGGDPLSVYRAVGETGSGVTPKLPQNCACLVRKNTSRGGRTGKGRFYVPNILNEGDVDAVGVISPSFVNGLQDAFDGFLDYLADDQTAPAVPMVLLHSAGVPGGTTPDVVTSLTVDPVIATQRRRLRR